MLIKECRNYLLSECANCGCHLKKEDIVTQPTVAIPGSNLSENNFNINAISYIYKIPPEELIANVLSYIKKQSGQRSTQSGNLTADECSQMDFVFCKTCAPLFGEVYRSHKIFHLWSAVGNLISKAIQPYGPLKSRNIPKSVLTVEDTTESPEIEIKNEIGNQETDCIEETGNWENNFVYIEPTNQCENFCESESLNNDPLSDDIKFEVDSVDFGNNQNNSDSFSEIVTNSISNDGNGSTIFDSHQTQTASESRPGKQVFVNTSLDPQRNKSNDDTNSFLINGPPFHCPRCTKMPPFQYPNGLRLHCQIDHQLSIPDSAFSKEALKNSDMNYTTHPTDIKGPPFQCPICSESFKDRERLKRHCKNVHLLLLPPKIIIRRFSCRLCEKEFRGSGTWEYHYRSQHNCRFVCRLCKIGFETNENLQTHFKTDCGGDASLGQATTTNSPIVAETEENSIENVNKDDNVAQPRIGTTTDKNVANNSQPPDATFMNKETASNVNKKPTDKFIFLKRKLSETPPIECYMGGCNEKFEQISLLEDHYLTVHQLILKVKDKKMSTFFCHECTESVYGKEEFKEHLLAAHKEKFAICKPPSEDSSAVLEQSRLKCDKCGLTFEHYNLLKQHSFESHSITLESYEQRFFHFLCRICDTSFETSNGLKIHSRQHCDKNINIKDKEFGCKYCSTTFNSTQKLISHMKYVHDIKKSDLYLENDPHVLKCSICLNEFNSHRDLHYHKELSRENAINSVNGNLSPVTCQFCQARFATSISLKSHHVLKHHKEHYQNSQSLHAHCDVCCKSFCSQDSLDSHIRHTHMKLKKTCKICKKDILYYSYALHMRQAHTGYSPYKCKFCDKTFMSSSTQKNHEATVHNEACPFLCPTCGRGFKLKVNLKLHEETHMTGKGFICERCGILLKTSATYKLHMRNHRKDDLAGPNPKCDKCDKTFSSGTKLRHHKLISHNKHGPIPCHICGKKFAIRSRVTEHIKAVHPESLRKEDHLTVVWRTRRLRSRKIKTS